MSREESPMSIWQKGSWFLLFCILAVLVMVYAQTILVPLMLGAMLAMLLLPLNQFLERKLRLGRGVAIAFSLLFFVALIALCIWLLSSQLVGFRSDLPAFQSKINDYIIGLQTLIQEKTHISDDEFSEYLRKAINSSLGEAQNVITNVLIATGNTVMLVSLMLVFCFFCLLYRSRIYQFILQMVPETSHARTDSMLHEISKVTQQYLAGVLTVMAILSVLNSIVFLIAGLPHAVFFGVLAAVLNVIPYLGVWIGTLLPLLLMLATGQSNSQVFIMLIGIWINQQIDNNFLTPKITGSKVSLNPLASTLGLLAGGMIWGVSGMVLFIPLMGVLKIVCDNVDELKPYGFLLGEEKDEKPAFWKRWFQKKADKTQAAQEEPSRKD